MKNVLFASTALVAFGFAGAAFAEAHASTSISLSGSAELGFTSIDDDASLANDGHIQLHNDFDLVWSLTGMTDGGIAFGATGDWDEANDEENAAVFISGAFGTITIGDTDGAFDKAMTEIASGGLADEADFYVNGNSGFDDIADAPGTTPGDNTPAQVGRYDIAFGGTTLSVSYEDGNDAAGNDNTYGIGVATTFGSIGFGLGYQENDDDYIAGASVSATLGVADLVVNYRDGEVATVDTEGYGASIVVALGAGSLGVNYSYDEVGAAESEGYGAFYSMSLGGGATFTAAAGTQEDAAGNDQTRFGAGIGMSF